MNIKRIITTIVGLPVVICAIVFCNKYIFDVLFAIVAIIAMKEYIKCVSKKAKPIGWISYLATALIAGIHLIPNAILMNVIMISIPALLVILFLHVIISNMKITYEDISYTLIGILYIFSFVVFLPLVFGLEARVPGKILFGYILTSTWGTDTCAYLIGKRFGKTKFSKVSPNKSVEGCIAGIIGTLILAICYTYAINKFGGYGISYLSITLISILLSIIGQVGDFSASSIKRHFEIKDFSELFPGHGGMIDRIDSVMFVAPFAYFLLTNFIV